MSRAKREVKYGHSILTTSDKADRPQGRFPEGFRTTGSAALLRALLMTQKNRAGVQPMPIAQEELGIRRSARRAVEPVVAETRLAYIGEAASQ